jgi:DNA replication protein DnaC
MSKDQPSKQPEYAPRPADATSPKDWTAEQRAEVERMGRDAMERMRTGAQRHQAAAGPARPPAGRPFVPVMGACPSHGEYAQNFLDSEGTERWHGIGCPACARQAAVDRLLERAAISPRFAHCTFAGFRADTPAQRAALEACEAYAREFRTNRERGTCLILRGNPGTGKNHLATAIARAVLAQGFTALNATAFDIIDRIRESWNPRSTESEAQVVRRFAEIDLLIIDEVGRHYQAKDGSDSLELFKVIDQRYRAVLPTIAISNLDKEGLQRALGAAAYDRLREGGARIANFDWESARGG